MRRRKGEARRVLIAIFCVVAFLTILIQLWLILQRRQCSQWLEIPADMDVKQTEPPEASLLDHVWSGLDVTTSACLGPQFSSLSKWNDTTQSLQLISDCPAGHFSFSVSDQSTLHLSFPNTGAIELDRETANSNSPTPREFVRVICPKIEHFPLPQGKRGWNNYHAMVSRIQIQYKSRASSHFLSVAFPQ